MSRRREADRPAEKKPPPEKKPPGRFVRRGPHWLDGRSVPPDRWVVLSERLTSPEEKAQLRVRHPFLLGFELFDGTLGADEAGMLACRYLSEAEAKFDNLLRRVVEHTASVKLPINAVSVGTEGRYCMVFAKYLLAELSAEAALLAALAFAAGFETGRLHEAEQQVAEIVAGDKVRRGGMSGAEKRRKNSGTPPTDERIAASRAALASGRSIRAAADHVAETLGTSAEAERRWYHRNRERIASATGPDRLTKN